MIDYKFYNWMERFCSVMILNLPNRQFFIHILNFFTIYLRIKPFFKWSSVIFFNHQITKSLNYQIGFSIILHPYDANKKIKFTRLHHVNCGQYDWFWYFYCTGRYESRPWFSLHAFIGLGGDRYSYFFSSIV